MTIHWIDIDTLERKGCCLAVREVSGRHTYDVLAKLMSSINEEYELTDKTCFTVTDSGANFLKAFKHFSVEEGAEDSTTASVDESDDMQFHELHELLNPPDLTDDGADADVIYKLPQHWRCACHSLNLVASSDASKLSDTVKRISTQTFAKLQGLWNKQNRSALAAQKIRTALGSLLITPGETRWNSTYDSIAQIDRLLSTPETEAKFDKLCDELDIKRLQPLQKAFVDEYVQVLQPVSSGLDVLQGEKEVGLGHLLPTLSVIKEQLNDLLAKNKLSVCGPVVRLLLDGIDRRFQLMLTNTEAQLAAVVHPKFKLDWVVDEHESSRLVNLLKKRMHSVGSSASTEQPTTSSEVCGHSTVETSAVPPQQDFFAVLAARRQQAAAGVGFDIDEELSRYLSDNSAELTALNSYPHIRKLYLALNTGLPASAAVERLFSLGGRVFSPLRSKLSSEHFEMMVFLRSVRF